MIFFLKKKVGSFLPQFVKDILRNVKIDTYKIVQSPVNELEIYEKIKDDSWEDTYYPECYEHNKEQHLKVFIPAQYIFHASNGKVNATSDVVLIGKKAYWSKFNNEEFVTWAKPCDNNVRGFTREIIRVARAKKKVYISGKVLSLVGLWSHHWVHSLYEFMPKLFISGEKGLLNQPITILVVENFDRSNLDVIKRYISVFPSVKIKFAKENVDYTCEELYILPEMGPSFCDYKFRLDYPFAISSNVVEIIDKYVVKPLVELVKDQEPKYERLYLGRNSAYTKNGRNLINAEEVHDYFMKLGFIDVEGAVLTLEQKAEIFYHAKEIVGMTGASLMNLIFCNGAKCLIMGNYRFATDSIGYTFSKKYIDRYIYLTGQDESDEYHCNYYIPIEKVKRAYAECVGTNFV